MSNKSFKNKENTEGKTINIKGSITTSQGQIPQQQQAQQQQQKQGFVYKDPKALQSWDVIEQAIQMIYEKKTHTLSYQELYHHAYILAFYGHGDQAYSRLKSLLEKYSLKMLNTLGYYDSEEQILVKMVAVWQDYKQMINILKGIFLYLDNNYVHTKNLQPVLVLGYDVFQQILFVQKQDIYSKVLEIILEMIDKQRLGENIEGQLIQKIIQMSVDLGMKANIQKCNQYSRQIQYEYTPELVIYEKYFEKGYLNCSEKYFSEESQRLILQLSPKDYIIAVERRFLEEKKRVHSYFYQSSKNKIQSLFFQKYINDFAKTIIDNQENGLFNWLDNDEVVIIKKSHTLFQNTKESYTIFLNIFYKYVAHQTSNLAARQSISVKEYIEDIILFRLKILNIMQEAFFSQLKTDDQLTIQRQTQKQFEDSLNDSNFPTEQLNCYIDEAFQKDFKNKSEQQIEEILNSVFEIFCLIRNKDYFASVYMKSLAKRILYNKSLDENNEKQIISKFKLECGTVYTKKMETMFLDMQQSLEYYSEFKQLFIKNINAKSAYKSLDFDIKVLTCGNWPYKLNQYSQVKIPNQLEPYIFEFEKHYKSKFKGRKLKWIYSVGKSIVKGYYSFNNSKKEFQVSNVQMVILLLFNNKIKYNQQELTTLLQMPYEEYKLHLLPLVQLKILKSENNIDFEYNDQFSYKNMRVQVNVMKKEANKTESSKNLEQICLERKFVVESLIVKIMKSRRKMDHQELYQEVVKISQQHLFLPDQQTVKQCVNSLINRDYIRLSENKDYLQYVV
ncbi:hypothetical protein ABPG74_022417 [Tetrahymena malaccensis]